MLHYTPQHVSSSTLLVLRRTNFITTAYGIVTLQTAVQYAGGERTAVRSPPAYCTAAYRRVTIPEAVVIQLVLLMMSSVLLETC